MNIIATIQNDGYTFNFYIDAKYHDSTPADAKHQRVYLSLLTDACSADFVSCPNCPLYYQCKDTPVAIVLARFKPDVISTHPEFFL